MDDDGMGHAARQRAAPGHRPVPRRRADQREAPARLWPRRGRGRARQGLIAALLWALLAQPLLAETLRIASYHAELSRKGPGLLLRDIRSGEDPQVAAVARVVAAVDADILVLQGVDYDHGHIALRALRDAIARAGPRYPHLFALRPNTGMATGRDLDGDGRKGEPEDAQGYGWFAGEGGMAILSRHPVEADGVRDFSALLWRDLPGAIAPDSPPEVAAAQRLSRVAHWAVPVRVAGATVTLLTFHASPPVFDGPEDRNGRRNHDEIVFWQHYLDGAFGPAPRARFVIAGNANLDPVDGEGRKPAIRRLLGDPRVQDPEPRRPGPVSERFGHAGDPALDTAAWAGPDPGHLRVSHVLPSADLALAGAGVHWPQTGDAAASAAAASRHRPVWVDIVIDW
jgi:hypothetical protein